MKRNLPSHIKQLNKKKYRFIYNKCFETLRIVNMGHWWKNIYSLQLTVFVFKTS